MKKPIKILFIEDVVDDFELTLLLLKRAGLHFEATRAETENEIMEAFSTQDFDLILSDNELPKINALNALKLIREIDEEVPFIILSGSIGEEYAASLMRLGANDYILKTNLSRLVPAINREIKEYTLKKKQKSFGKELVLSELRFQNLTKSISDIFFAVDYDLRITFWNKIAEKEFNKNVSLGTHIYSLFPEWVDEDISKAIKKAIKSTEAHPFKLKCVIEGKVEFFEGTVSSSSDGASVLLRKVTETYLNRKKLEKLNNELEVLLYRISHDLKGPVSSVIGLLNIMKMAPDFDKIHFIEMMTQRMNHLEKTLRVLRNVANIKYGKFEKDEINIREAILNLIEIISINDMKDIVHVDFKSDENASYKGDLMLFNCIFQNLLENAIKYGADEEGIVHIQIKSSCTDSDIEITISDRGRGIPEQIRDDIFQMFFRGDEKSDGSGMGLYIVKHALEKIGGKIELDTEYKLGTKFKVTIPSNHKVLVGLEILKEEGANASRAKNR
ncbi:MAG: ATP-binding protein [Fulvivirga sp.]|uniref:ATP-binding protein n=1 Tax=Fulvivirga sp. TaxID=1931237 RepID=UPI0032ECEDA9